MSKRDPKLLAGDTLESTYKTLEYTRDVIFTEFMSDGKTIVNF
jgi:hypothetical protein